LTNAHANDAQSGYETGMNTTAALLAGADMFNMGGLLSSLMAFDFAKIVIDNEIAMMLKRINRGLEFSEENLALEVIADIGIGKSYLEHPHTENHMRTTAVLPKIATRGMRRTWEDKKRSDAHSRAMSEAIKILKKDNPSVFSEDVDARIRSRFEGLVAGNAVWKE